MLIVIALGGNALLKRNEEPSASNLGKNIDIAARQIAKLIPEHQILIVHGNGPQIGLLALQAEAYHAVPPYPFDILNAESQGMIGYVLQQALQNYLPQHSVCTLLTQVIVDAHDPAFKNPTKPIGSANSQRMIASPLPQQVVELDSIKSLLSTQTVVIAAGGGGIPCIKKDNILTGIEAVIDKDLTASLLAQQLGAEQFIILTNVDGIYENWQQSQQKLLTVVSTQQLDKMPFATGSMQPKVDAACEFVLKTKGAAKIGNLKYLEQIMQDKSGTNIVI
jgi:carbamate kinase